LRRWLEESSKGEKGKGGGSYQSAWEALKEDL